MTPMRTSPAMAPDNPPMMACFCREPLDGAATFELALEVSDVLLVDEVVAVLHGRLSEPCVITFGRIARVSGDVDGECVASMEELLLNALVGTVEVGCTGSVDLCIVTNVVLKMVGPMTVTVDMVIVTHVATAVVLPVSGAVTMELPVTSVVLLGTNLALPVPM